MPSRWMSGRCLAACSPCLICASQVAQFTNTNSFEQALGQGFEYISGDIIRVGMKRVQQGHNSISFH